MGEGKAGMANAARRTVRQAAQTSSLAQQTPAAAKPAMLASHSN
jgi:hypothetical protein